MGIHNAGGYCLLIGSGYAYVARSVHVVRMCEFMALCVQRMRCSCDFSGGVHSRHSSSCIWACMSSEVVQSVPKWLLLDADVLKYVYRLSPRRCAHTHTVRCLARVMFEAQVSSFSVCVALLGEGLPYTIPDRYSATVV